MTDLRKPSAPWQPPAPPVVRTPCPGCQGTGRITTLAGIGPCDLCKDQRAIDDAVRSRAVMDAAEKRLSEAAAGKAAEKIAKAATKMPTSAEVMKDYASMTAKLNEHYAPHPFVKPVPTYPDAMLPNESAEAAGFAKPARTELQRNCVVCGGIGVVFGDGGDSFPCHRCSSAREPVVMSTVANIPTTASAPASSTTPPARILDISAALYHTDPIDPETPSLSNSIASTIVIDCAYLAWLAHPRLGNVPTPPTKLMERGVLHHAATLENGKGIKPLPFDDWRTKAAREARDEARADGLLPMLAREYEPLMAVGRDVRDTLADTEGMKLRGTSEVVVTWHEDSRFGPVLCRAMMDHLIVDEHTAEIIDLKFISSADLDTCVKHIHALGYDCQNAAYTSAVEKLYPHLAGRIRFRFAFIQIMPPRSPRRVLITPVELDGEFKVLGRERWQRGVETWKRCLDADQWPGYVPDGQVKRVSPKPWMLTGEMDIQRAGAAEDDSETDDETNES